MCPNLQVVILAAGMGKRLRPLTSETPKALLSVNGKTILEIILQSLAVLPVSSINIVIGYRGDKIAKCLGKNYGELPINYLVQEKQKGMADALSLTEGTINGNFLVMPCDVLVPTEHLRELHDRYNDSKYDAALSVIRLKSKEKKTGKTVEMSGKRIVRIVDGDVRERIRHKYMPTGIYILDESIFEYMKSIELPSGEFEMQYLIQAMLDNDLKLLGVITKDWIHLSEIQDYYRFKQSTKPSWLCTLY